MSVGDGRKWSDRAKEELQSIQSHLGPFMEKLAALSEEYELEKVAPTNKTSNPTQTTNINP